ncbi:DNA mismatch repair protein MutL [Halogranum amylolyticum]|uniref:DNA mismatch repair protein MutL n=1 Tax=Halogranum amylolyticum TaxID=660520 RepID=A0A1H8PVE6_9EURY|nr:DNA mismatch repair endonuclease MutL [Halogranum amylolyticum]SEO45920.1 DNA mismatch repair protein MutL [Halogranum amylolyticum]
MSDETNRGDETTETAQTNGTGRPADERPTIQALDQTTVQRIAAGEVVERPASVVKELVENSLDADASRVSVAVRNGGKDGVRVRDDGVGMTEDELAVAVEEHTTSKISDIDDLETGVATLGFRGEALHTIGAVSRTTVRSKPRGAAGAGAELTVEGGDVGEVRPAGCPAGTTIEVDDLFFNTPARKKFLKTDATEFDHVNTVVTQYALANPGVAVSLEHNDREVFATEGRGSLESTVLSVYGREVAEAMTTVDADPDGDTVDSVSGLVSHPETTRAGREYLSTFVNGRYVTAGTLREAVLDAYGGQLAPDRYPFAVLFLDVPANSVDVNVHPRKMEVRFDDESGVKSAVEAAVESALLDEGLIRSSAPRGRSAPDETQVAPERPDDGPSEDVADGDGGDGDTDEAVTATTSSNPDGDGATAESSAATTVDSADDAATDPADATADTDPESPSTSGPDDAGTDEEAWVVDNARSSRSGSETADSTAAEATPDFEAATAEWEFPEQRARTDDREREAESPDVDAGDHDAASRPSPRSWQQSSLDEDRDGDDPGETDATEQSAAFTVAGPTSQRTLDGEAAAVGGEFDSLPSLRVLGQLFDTYLVAETADGLVLVDQHAADERVNYERLRGELRGDTPTQGLAEPVELELTAREAALFAEYADALAELGFDAERTDERTVAVRSVPAVFDAALDPELLRDALTAFVAESDDGGRETVDAVVDSLLADLACYPSITGNTSLTEGSVVELLEALDACENPYACPHGRPVVIEFDRGEIEDRFERDYPGHAGRRREE